MIAILTRAGVDPEWPVQRPTEATNAILLPVELGAADLEPWQVRQQKLEKAVTLLRGLRSAPFDAIRARHLSTAMRIHTRAFYLPLPAHFVKECGRLGLEICILNKAAGE